MYNKLVKLRNKKAFTLVEMLAVIAIVAVLVAIVVPIVGKSTTKARAATNAANLRAVEGMISTKRVEQPLAFNNSIDQLGVSLGNYLNGLGISNIVTSDVVTIVKAVVAGAEANSDLLDALEQLPLIGSSISDLITKSQNYMDYKLYHSTAVNGVLSISSTPVLEFNNVPVSVECNAGNMVLPAGIQMTVYITENDIIATYEYNGNSYTIEDFAEVAETGDFTKATGSGGNTSAGVEGELGCAYGNHSWSGDDGTGTKHICKWCSETKDHSYPWSGLTAKCRTCGYIKDHEHSWNNAVCSKCGQTYLEVYPGHICADTDNDHYCNGCGTKISECAADENSHFCSTCGARMSACYDDPSDGKHECTVCRETMDTECADNDGDGYCDDCNGKITHTCNQYKANSFFDSTCTCGHSKADHAHTVETKHKCSADDYSEKGGFINKTKCGKCQQDGHTSAVDYEWTTTETVYTYCNHNTD